MTGAISQDRESCQFLFCLTKIPPLYRSARPESGWEGRERLFMELLARTQSEQLRRLALAGWFSGLVFGSQVVWNRSNRCAGARGGARVGRPRWVRILTITGGSSIAAMIQGAAIRAVLHVDVEDPFEQPGQLMRAGA